MRERCLSVFDLDHTLLNVNISFAFGQYLFQKRFLPFFSMAALVFCYAAHKAKLLSLNRLHHTTFNLFFKGKKKTFLEEEAALFLEERLSSFLFAPAVERLTPFSYLLSASPDFLVAPVAQRLGIQGWGATTYQVDKDGALCKISGIMEGSCKAHMLKRFANEHAFSLDAVYFYSDSYEDRAAFEAAGRGVAVRPDRKLRKLAQKKGWEIIDDAPSSCSTSYSGKKTTSC